MQPVEAPFTRVFANAPDDVDAGMLVRFLHRFAVLLADRGVALRKGLVQETHAQHLEAVILDGDRQRSGRNFRRRLRGDVNTLHRHQRDFIAHAVAAELQLALQAIFAARGDNAAVEARHKRDRRLDVSHQSPPELIARQGIEQRIKRVVDLDQMFESHATA